MTARPSAYREGLQVSPERIATMTDGELNVLMGELLAAQAYSCGAPVSEVQVNTQTAAADDGCDGWSPKPPAPDPWLGETATCWQFKAGQQGQASRINGETTKAIPRQTLQAGGRFVLIASGSTSGPKGESERRAVLVEDAVAAGLPADRIDVLGSGRVANWCNQHPAIAARWAGHPDGLWTLDEWSASPLHRLPWHATAEANAAMASHSASLDFATGGVWHLHVLGQPGVGKTRFVLELCRSAPWKRAVVYVRDAADVRLGELLDGATADPGVRVVVVADEVQAEQLARLRDSLDRGNGRVRLITIGHSKSPDPSRTPDHEVRPLPTQQMADVVKSGYPALPQEHIDFVVHFADGFVRLARLAADEVVRSPNINVRDLLDRQHIRGFFDRMLGTGDHSSLYVVAALSSVGWAADREAEGSAIAKHLGLDWSKVRRDVDDFNRRLGIAPRGGRLRYISPLPLGIYLAVEAWTTYPAEMRSLATVLPSELAKDAYHERLRTIATSPQARQFAREELAFFFELTHFLDERAVKRWSALAPADPALAARNLAAALQNASLAERLSIAAGARRELVWGLARLAWKPSVFRDAVMALALLGEAENESWASNASNEFAARFQLYLGGTATPYLRRLEVLDELVALGRASINRLAIKALTKVGNQFETGSRPDIAVGEAPEPQWHPSSADEYLAAVLAAVERLAAIARSGDPELEPDFVKAADDLSMFLRDDARVRDPVVGLFESVRNAYPSTREPLRRIIASILSREVKLWKELQPADVDTLKEIHKRFEDPSFSARLRQFVGASAWDDGDWDDEAEGPRGADAFPELATSLIENPRALTAEWPWLTSGEAGRGWDFGRALAEADRQGELEGILPSLPGTGRDLRILGGYVKARRHTQGDTWFEQWVAQHFQDARDAPVLCEVTWRCGATDTTTRQLADLVRKHGLDEHIAGGLSFGRWHESVSREALNDLISALVERGRSSAAVAVLEHRLTSAPDELAYWIPMATKLVTTSELVRSGDTMTSHYWHKVALLLVPHSAGDIAAAIFREQDTRDASHWYAQHSTAKDVLYACVKADASAVWEQLVPFLATEADAYSFSVGFPKGLFEKMPASAVTEWIGANPHDRAPLAARFLSKDFSSDATLGSQVLGAYGDDEDVRDAFFSAYVSGSWGGPASVHWESLARTQDEVALRTKLPKLRRWAEESAARLREMAGRDRQREEEEALRWR